MDLDLGTVDPRTGQQQATVRFKITDQLVLTGDVGVRRRFSREAEISDSFSLTCDTGFSSCLGTVTLAFQVAAQTRRCCAAGRATESAAAVVKEQEKRAKQASIIEFRGQQAFKEKDLRTALKEEITTIEDFGLSPARGGRSRVFP